MSTVFKLITIPEQESSDTTSEPPLSAGTTLFVDYGGIHSFNSSPPTIIIGVQSIRHVTSLNPTVFHHQQCDCDAAVPYS